MIFRKSWKFSTDLGNFFSGFGKTFLDQENFPKLKFRLWKLLLSFRHYFRAFKNFFLGLGIFFKLTKFFLGFETFFPTLRIFSELQEHFLSFNKFFQVSRPSRPELLEFIPSLNNFFFFLSF